MAVLYRYDAALGAFVPATGAPGPKGDQGAPGPKGDTGPPGPKGDTGPAGTFDSSGATVPASSVTPGSFQNGQYNFTTMNATTDIEFNDRSISRGHVASATKTTNSGPGNSTTVYTTIITTPSFPVIAGRRYKVTGQAYQVTNATAGRSFIFDYFVASGGASLAWEPNRDFQTFATAATLPLGNHVGWFVSNSTVNITLSWRFISSGTAGSLTVIGNATDPIAIHVEDMGI